MLQQAAARLVFIPVRTRSRPVKCCGGTYRQRMIYKYRRWLSQAVIGCWCTSRPWAAAAVPAAPRAAGKASPPLMIILHGFVFSFVLVMGRKNNNNKRKIDMVLGVKKNALKLKRAGHDRTTVQAFMPMIS